MKKAFMLLLAMLVGMAAFSQSVDEQKKKIAAIKKSNSYISAEMTLPDQQQAIDLATDMLHQRINEWAATQKKFAGASKIVTTNTNYAVEQITMPRANMFRAFMYVKKSDIIPADNVDVRQAPTEVVSAKAPKALKPATVTPISDSRHDAVVSELLKVGNTGQLLEKLKELKGNGKITTFANLQGLKGMNLSEYIMVVFNREGVVEAVLSEGDNRTNLQTGEPDQLANYKGRGAIGVKVKK